MVAGGLHGVEPDGVGRGHVDGVVQLPLVLVPGFGTFIFRRGFVNSDLTQPHKPTLRRRRPRLWRSRGRGATRSSASQRTPRPAPPPGPESPCGPESETK